MDASPSFSASDAGSVSTQRLDDKITEIVYRGRMTARLIDEAHAQIEPRLRNSPSMGILVNTDAVTSFDPMLPVSTRSTVDHYRRYTGLRIAAVIPSAALRMTVQAIAFASGLPLRLFETRRDAVAYLR